MGYGMTVIRTDLSPPEWSKDQTDVIKNMMDNLENGWVIERADTTKNSIVYILKKED